MNMTMDTEKRDSVTTSIATTRSRESYYKTNETKTISSFDEYEEFLRFYDDPRPLYIYYCGTHSPHSGYSWCQNCVKALPVVEQALNKNYCSWYFLIVEVGSQDEWEDKANPFRMKKSLNLKVLPTILKFKSPKRLEGEYCMKPELLELLFEEECEF